MSRRRELRLRLDDVADLVHAINAARERIVGTLAGYLALSARMREFEDTFAAQVLHAAQQLHEVVEERRRLESQWRRIRQKADRHEYDSLEELRDDIDAALTPADADRFGEPDEVPQSPAEEALDQETRDRIVREFRRIVLPNIHPDTSDTPYPVFEAAFSAYRASDYTLMEAFVIQYRGAVAPAASADNQKQLSNRLHDYLAAERRLDHRYRELRQAVTDGELRQPEQTRERMRQRQEEFRRAIILEAERVQELRARLEALRDGSER